MDCGAGGNRSEAGYVEIGLGVHRDPSAEVGLTSGQGGRDKRHRDGEPEASGGADTEYYQN